MKIIQYKDDIVIDIINISDDVTMENIAIVEDIPPFEYREGFNGILKYSENGIYWHYEQAIIANNVSAEEFLDMIEEVL